MNSGVVDKNVNIDLDARRQLARRLGARQIDRDRSGANPVRARDLRRRLLDLGGAIAHEHEVVAAPRQPFGQRAPDPRAAPGDERDHSSTYLRRNFTATDPWPISASL